MRGSIVRRYEGSYSLIIDLGYQPDPITGKPKRKQKWHTFRGTRKDAEKRLTDLLNAVDKGTYVDSSKMTLGQWLKEWLEVAIKPPRCRPSTYTRYKGIIENDLLKAPIASTPLQRIRSTHIEQYYADAKVSPSTLTLHHAIVHRALRKAVKDKLLAMNPAVDLDGKPRRKRDKGEDARRHCWTVAEARAFLAEAKAAGAQPAAFYTLALDSGMRKGELCGLLWEHVDLDAEECGSSSSCSPRSSTTRGSLSSVPRKRDGRGQSPSRRRRSRYFERIASVSSS
jgi:integrase